jgi:hypothetical protein
VAVRSAGSAVEQGEASATMSYTMSAAPAPSTPQAGPYKMVEISPSKASPQAINTAITWTATASGSSAPAAQFSWVPKMAGNHLIGVWVKRTDNHNDAAEASYTTAYVIK